MFILAAMGSAALPGLNGFVGEFPILLGMYRTSSRRMRSSPRLGMILGAYYLLWMLQRVVFGPLKEPVGDPRSAATGSSRPGRCTGRPAGRRLARDRGARPACWS